MIKSAPFETPKEVLNWASEAIDELNASCVAFFDSGNFREVREFNPDSRQNILKVVGVAELPKIIPRRATEALANIRNSFDQIVYGACWAIGKRSKDSIYFPWADSPTDLEFRLGAKSAKPPKIPPELWPILRTFEPYRRSDSHIGGDDLIRELAKIANRKHTIRLDFSVKIAGMHAPRFHGSVPAGSEFVLSMPRWDAVKNEVVIAKFPPEMHTDYKYTLHGYVALDEAAPLKGVPIVDALKAFAAKAQTVLEGLEGEANRILAP